MQRLSRSPDLTGLAGLSDLSGLAMAGPQGIRSVSYSIGFRALQVFILESGARIRGRGRLTQAWCATSPITQ